MRAAANAAIENNFNVAANRLHNFFQLVKRAAPAVELTPAMIRNHNGIGPHIHGAARIGNAHHPFEAKFSVPVPAQFGGIVPAHILVQHGRKIIAHGNGDIRALADMVFQLRQFKFFAQEKIERPTWLGGKLKHAGRGQARRGGKAGSQIALALAAGNRVDGQGENIELRGLCHLQHRRVQTPVFVKIELEHFRRGNQRPNFIKPHRAQRRHAEQRVELFRRARHGALAFMVKQPLQGGRRTKNRQTQLAAHHLNRHVDISNPGQHIGHEVIIFKGVRVAPVGHLIIGRAVDIVKDRPRQTAAREIAQIIDITAL